jgi:hypothetical protein
MLHEGSKVAIFMPWVKAFVHFPVSFIGIHDIAPLSCCYLLSFVAFCLDSFAFLLSFVVVFCFWYSLHRLLLFFCVAKRKVSKRKGDFCPIAPRDKRGSALLRGEFLLTVATGQVLFSCVSLVGRC